MEDYAPFIFLRNWVLMVLHLCSRFHIFDRPVLEYVSLVEGGPHLLQSCLYATWDDFLPIIKKMHPSFENLAVINALGLHTSLMDIHHDTYVRSIFEDGSNSLTFRACIRSCLGKGAWLWLVVKLFIHSFWITHLLSPQHCIFILIWFSLWHLIFSHVNVDMGWMHLTCT
jgi:hypothetical protein